MLCQSGKISPNLDKTSYILQGNQIKNYRGRSNRLSVSIEKRFRLSQVYR